MWKLIFVYPIIIFYIVMAYLLCKKWIFFFLHDEEMSPSDRSISRIILAIATLLWPIVVPFAYLELLSFNIKHKKDIDLLRNPTQVGIGDDEN
ncbi:hypothetical protein FD725_27150 [Nostoc sp. TCL26-01]|nr:hypothetical protein FD725_27150 [Nostoc sp. TCL26-01]